MLITVDNELQYPNFEDDENSHVGRDHERDDLLTSQASHSSLRKWKC